MKARVIAHLVDVWIDALARYRFDDLDQQHNPYLQDRQGSRLARFAATRTDIRGGSEEASALGRELAALV